MAPGLRVSRLSKLRALSGRSLICFLADQTGNGRSRDVDERRLPGNGNLLCELADLEP